MSSSVIDKRIEKYPPKAKQAADKIRRMVHETAESEHLGTVEESLKWGEPSFTVKGGSPFRMDWKEDTPRMFYIFFVCSTSLVETFKVIYEGALEFQGNRAIVLDLNEELPGDILRHCVSLAMRYHKLKKLPLLGA